MSLAILATGKMFAPFAAATSCSHSFFFLPPWWEYLQLNNDCSVAFHGLGDVWLVALAVIDIMLRIAAFLAVISISIGAVEYIIAIGNPERITSARKRIVNSLVGLAIVLTATAIVTFVGKALG